LPRTLTLNDPGGGTMGTRLLLGAAIAVVLAGGAEPVLAATQTSVDCGAGASLQAAIDAAKPGTILAISGTCQGTFTVAKTLVLKGAPAAVLDGRQAGTTLTVSAGTVRVTNVTITGGRAPDAGAGIQNAGTLTLVRVTVQGNDGADDAGGIENHGTLTLQRSAVTHNLSDNAGIWNLGTATLEQSTVSFSGSTGIISESNAASLTMTDSTVSNNRSMPQPGGIWNVGGAVVIVRSTIANNASGNSSGGGIVNGGGSLSVTSSTISGNEADEGGAGIMGSATLTATILAGNVDANDGVTAEDCVGPITSRGYNLLGRPCAPYTIATDLAVINHPLLKVLGNYGGPTQTMVPRPHSPAANAIAVGATSGDGTTPLCPASGTADQRGIARPQSGACDVGSVERKPKE
jgi:hypothetical protein